MAKSEFLDSIVTPLQYSIWTLGVKEICNTIKEVIGEVKSTDNNIPKRMIIDYIESFDQRQIKNRFNKFFTEIGPKPVSSISNSSKGFIGFISVFGTFLV